MEAAHMERVAHNPDTNCVIRKVSSTLAMPSKRFVLDVACRVIASTSTTIIINVFNNKCLPFTKIEAPLVVHLILVLFHKYKNRWNNIEIQA